MKRARTHSEDTAPASLADVRARLVEALKLDLVGPWTGHALSEERLPGWERPSNRYLTGFLIPANTAPDRKGADDEDDDIGEVPESAGLAEESNEERKAAKKGFFPSSMGLSFLCRREITITVRSRELGRLTLTKRELWGSLVERSIPAACAPMGKRSSI